MSWKHGVRSSTTSQTGGPGYHAAEVEHDGDDEFVESSRWRRRALGAALAVVVGAVGAGAWWNRAVTADPGLILVGGANVFRNKAGGDVNGITQVTNSFGTDVNVAYEAGSGIHAFFGLSNRGRRTVRIEGMAPEGFYYWGLDGVAVSEDLRTGSYGGEYKPFQPFTLRPGETRAVRVDFRQASCDPAGLQDGSSRLDSLPVRYRTLGWTRTADLPFEEVTIAVRTMGVCDRPL
jgi:hypothetical protein